MTKAKEGMVDQENLRIGRQIRDLRKSKGITLTTMAEKIGRSVGYISQVERGVSSLPISILQNISDILGVKVSWFFHADSEVPLDELKYIVRRHSRRSLNYSGSGIKEELLSPRLSGQMQMILTTIDPGKGNRQPRKRCGEEGGLVQSGTLELGIGDKIFILNAGDSFSLTGDEPHWLRNPSDTQETVIVWTLVAGY